LNCHESRIAHSLTATLQTCKTNRNITYRNTLKWRRIIIWERIK